MNSCDDGCTPDGTTGGASATDARGGGGGDDGFSALQDPIRTGSNMMDRSYSGGLSLPAGINTSRVESILSDLKPIQDLAKNWDIDIASWYVGNEPVNWDVIVLNCLTNSPITAPTVWKNI